MSADFSDSNVFIYLFDDTDERKRAIADGIVRQALADGNGVISCQVGQETLNVLVRKPGASTYDAGRFLDAVLAPLWRIAPSARLYADALEIHDRSRFGFFDSLIVAAAIEGGCSRLLSEDLQHDPPMHALRVFGPFH